MDDIITLVIVLITVVSAISRIRSKQNSKSGATPGKGGELGSKLKAFFAEIQRQLEDQAPRDRSGDASWDRMRQERQPDDPEQDYEFAPEELELELEEEQLPAPQMRKPPAPPAGDSPVPAATQAVDSAPSSCAPDSLDVKGALCPDFLRRAVVWSEILGPPKALQDTPWER